MHIYIRLKVNNGKESDNMEKNWKTVIQSEEFNMKESWCYNISGLINHHQDLERMLSSVVRSPTLTLDYSVFQFFPIHKIEMYKGEDKTQAKDWKKNRHEIINNFSGHIFIQGSSCHPSLLVSILGKFSRQYLISVELMSIRFCWLANTSVSIHRSP